MPRLLFLTACFLAHTLFAADLVTFQDTACEGTYPRHLQGVCTNDRDAIYWSWTDALVKTDANGKVIKKVPAADHHGDLCFHEGRVYVAVNLGKFNQPAGQADSWVYVYDGDTLAELARHAIPELVHGAGGIAFHDGTFIVIGGLPPGTEENYLYEYDLKFAFRQRHVLASGYTKMGIQTAAWAKGQWWFGTYGTPPELMRADATFKFIEKHPFNASVGLEALPDGRFLIGVNTVVKEGTKTVGNTGKVKAVDSSALQ